MPQQLPRISSDNKAT